jgi:hypothetical protein
LAAVSISVIGNSPGAGLAVSSSVFVPALSVVIDIFYTTPVNGYAPWNRVWLTLIVLIYAVSTSFLFLTFVSS